MDSLFPRPQEMRCEGDKGTCLVAIVFWEIWAIPPLESTMGGI
jgi:hypothetical protein